MNRITQHLLIIDPQNDFCDLPPDWCAPGAAPSLPVTGAHADMLRIAALIDGLGATLTDITVTLDSHQHLDIAHPSFWRRGDGSAVSPFTQISAAEVRAGVFIPRLGGALPRVLAYLDALEAAGRYRHMVWPIHCEIGSWGHGIHAAVRAACNRWEEQQTAWVNMVSKGSNPWTEHYSAMRAEVPLEDDASTQLNNGLMQRLLQSERVLICGEAGSHCVRATTEHIVDNWPRQQLGRLVLLSDCMSPVSGFEAQYEAFVANMASRGVAISSAAALGA